MYILHLPETLAGELFEESIRDSLERDGELEIAVEELNIDETVDLTDSVLYDNGQMFKILGSPADNNRR